MLGREDGAEVLPVIGQEGAADPAGRGAAPDDEQGRDHERALGDDEALEGGGRESNGRGVQNEARQQRPEGAGPPDRRGRRRLERDGLDGCSREDRRAQSEMNAICADLERQGWTLNPNGDRPDASRSYKRGGWYLLVSGRGKTQAPSTTSALTDSQTYLTLTGLRLNLSDIPLPEITVRIG
ncbi:hypothetical protein GCM10010343_12540 [Streptomyces avidinii]|nr:hypothetical protein GCM10010343_12540 [Streptomyces avidinii]